MTRTKRQEPGLAAMGRARAAVLCIGAVGAAAVQGLNGCTTGSTYPESQAVVSNARPEEGEVATSETGGAEAGAGQDRGDVPAGDAASGSGSGDRECQDVCRTLTQCGDGAVSARHCLEDCRTSRTADDGTRCLARAVYLINEEGCPTMLETYRRYRDKPESLSACDPKSGDDGGDVILE